MEYLLVHVLGKKGVVLLVATIFFFLTAKNSKKIFNWIEDQTFGTRDYILEKLELLFIKIEPSMITGILMGLVVVPFVLVVGIFALLGAFGKGIFLGVVLAIIGWKIPRPLIDMMVRKKNENYQNQMVDAMNLLANGVRAGLSLPQAIGLVVNELPNPIAQEFNLVLEQSRIGSPLEEALENLYARVPLDDNQMFVTSVNILKETGGNLAEAFDSVTSVIRERVRLYQKIATFVAQGMFQGAAMVAMPFVLLVILGGSDPELIAPLFTTIPGNIFLCIAVILDLLGGYVIMKIVKIKV